MAPYNTTAGNNISTLTSSSTSSSFHMDTSGTINLDISNDAIDANVKLAPYVRWSNEKRIRGKKKVIRIKNVEWLATHAIKSIKPNMNWLEKRKYKRMAEKCFIEACEKLEMGMNDLSAEFEREMEKNLSLMSIQAFNYKQFVDEAMIEKFRDSLPCQKELVITPINEWKKPIPKDAEKKLKKAQDQKTFDSFVVFWIQEVKDPIIFGTIKSQPGRYYFIAEWDNDISIDDILKFA